MPTDSPAETERVWNKALLYVGAGILLVSIVVAGASGGGGPSDTVEIRDELVGAQQFQTLSESGRERLEPLLADSGNATTVAEAEYGETFPELPTYREMRDSEVYHVVYEGRFYLLTLEETNNGTATLTATNNTDTVLLTYGDLRPSDQETIREAESTAGPLNVSSVPQFRQASGIEGNRYFDSQRLYYLSWDGEYYTVLTYEPAEFVETPTTGNIIGIVGIAVGIVCVLVGGVSALRS